MRILLVGLSAYLCACASSLPLAAQTEVLSNVTAQTEAPSDVDQTAEFLFDPFDPPIDRSIAYEDAIEKLRARFGTPENETSEVGLDNRDPSFESEFLVWYYEGFTVHLQGAAARKARWITQMEIVGDDYSLKYGLGLGKHRSDFLAVLEPELLNNDERRVRFSSDYSNSGVFGEQRISIHTNTILVVEFDVDGKAIKLTWRYYGD